MLLNLRHFNAEVTLDHIIFYYLKKFDETVFLKLGSFSVKFTLALAKVMLNLFPSVYFSIFIVMDFTTHIDTISILSISYFMGSQVDISKLYPSTLINIVYILTNSEGPGKMPLREVFTIGQSACLTGIQTGKG